MFRFLLIVVFSTFLLSCSNNSASKSRKRYKEFWVESNFVEDKQFHGLTKFFDSNNKLQIVETYSHGLNMGPSVTYHSNGRVYDSVIYKNGYRNGYRYVFDSTGQLSYQEYYSLGRKLGPQIFFFNGLVTDYNYNSFDKKNLYSYYSDSSGNKIGRKGELMTLTPYYTYNNGAMQKNIFAYLVRPPKISVTFELVARDPIDQKEYSLRTFDEQVYVDCHVPSNGYKLVYFIKASLYDSLEAKQQVQYSELVYRE